MDAFRKCVSVSLCLRVISGERGRADEREWQRLRHRLEAAPKALQLAFATDRDQHWRRTAHTGANEWLPADFTRRANGDRELAGLRLIAADLTRDERHQHRVGRPQRAPRRARWQIGLPSQVAAPAIERPQHVVARREVDALVIGGGEAGNIAADVPSPTFAAVVELDAHDALGGR